MTIPISALVPRAVAETYRRTKPMRPEDFENMPGPQGKRLRQQAGVTREALAVACGTSAVTIERWEAGRTTYPTALRTSETFRRMLATFAALAAQREAALAR